MLEVEAKFIVDDFDFLETKYDFAAPVLQQDTYYQHPSRDFLKTSEWLRVRKTTGKEYTGGEYYMVYKGPNEKIESGVKSRKEIEVPADVTIIELLQVLGFKELVAVEKHRRSAHIPECPAIITLDEVIGLGKFVEIEILTEEQGKSEAIKAIEKLADELKLTRPEKRGYAKLTLAKQSCGVSNRRFLLFPT